MAAPRSLNDDIGFLLPHEPAFLSLINPTIGWAMMPDNGPASQTKGHIFNMQIVLGA